MRVKSAPLHSVLYSILHSTLYRGGLHTTLYTLCCTLNVGRAVGSCCQQSVIMYIA
jgi:hypothetical protein